MNCWEFMQCPQGTFESCTAYPNRGLDCWKVTGNKCGKGQQEMGSIGEKILFCRQCDFYKQHANKI